jgi:Exo-beta-D-glucosaminidase Ig-fold domain
MYEGRNAQLFHPTTAVITWMSNPAQPSFVWQIYHYDFDPMSSFFAVMHASEMQHIQYNEATGVVQVINNLPEPLNDATAHVAIYGLDGKLAAEHDTKVNATPEAATNLGRVEFPAGISPVHFLKLELRDSSGKLVSSNFYWLGAENRPDDLSALNQLPSVTLDLKAQQKNDHGVRRVTITLHNPTTQIALMTHLELKRAQSGERVLPVFDSDNYISLVPGETKAITMEAEDGAFNGEKPLVSVDGWNVTVKTGSSHGIAIVPDVDAEPGHSPVTGLPYATTGLR